MHLPQSTSAGRIDNPGLYGVLYLGNSSAGAVAEAFGWARLWDARLLRGVPSLPGSVRALARYDLDDDRGPVCDLDDAARLVELRLRPSQVVTRDRTVTQGWATEIHGRHEFAGVSWWSYYDPRWGSVGLWDVSALELVAVDVLDELDRPEIAEAADVLGRIRR
ncbi:MAG: hypothetical protein QOG80_446 [Pseudonocardiales bacterium]|jgi:hypothetical protein|nr:hypothetical protein [Pseudonocardiales bacterium]